MWNKCKNRNSELQVSFIERIFFSSRQQLFRAEEKVTGTRECCDESFLNIIRLKWNGEEVSLRELAQLQATVPRYLSQSSFASRRFWVTAIFDYDYFSCSRKNVMFTSTHSRTISQKSRQLLQSQITIKFHFRNELRSSLN